MESEGKRGLIIFDFDGTLVDLSIDWGNIRDGLATLLNDYGISVRFGPGFTYRLFSSIDLLGKPDRDVLRGRADALYDAEEMGGIGQIKFKPGLFEMVDRYAKDYDLAISSNNGSKVITAVLQKAGISSHFRVVMSRNTARLKPDPEPLVKIIKELGSTEAYMVGDLPTDILAAKNAQRLVRARIKTIGITGPSEGSTFSGVKPDFLIRGIGELGTVIKP